MSEADKLFEELGYIKDKRLDGDLFYYQKNGANEKWGFRFNTGSKEVYPVCYSKENEAIYITMQELQAINKKCKELGWLDE